MTENTQERDQFIENLYQEMNFKMRIYAARKLYRPDQAEEAVQNALVVLCRRAETVMKHPNPQGWLMVTIQKVVLSMNRETYKEETMIAGNLDDVQVHYHDDHHRAEYDKLLSPEDFALIEMVVVQRYTIPEAAQELGITTEAAKKRKQRATKQLREQLLGNEK